MSYKDGIRYRVFDAPNSSRFEVGDGYDRVSYSRTFGFSFCSKLDINFSTRISKS